MFSGSLHNASSQRHDHVLVSGHAEDLFRRAARKVGSVVAKRLQWSIRVDHSTHHLKNRR